MSKETQDPLREAWAWPQQRHWGLALVKRNFNAVIYGVGEIEDEKIKEEIMGKMGIACSNLMFLPHMVRDHGYDMSVPDPHGDLLAVSFNQHIIESRHHPGCERRGDSFWVVYHRLGEGGIDCACPMARQGIIELRPCLCLCTAMAHKNIWQTVTKKPVDVELIETIAWGDDTCTLKVTVRE